MAHEVGALPVLVMGQHDGLKSSHKRGESEAYDIRTQDINQCELGLDDDIPF